MDERTYRGWLVTPLARPCSFVRDESDGQCRNEHVLACVADNRLRNTTNWGVTLLMSIK